MSKADEILERLARGWRPFPFQIPSASMVKRLEREGLIKFDYDDPDSNRARIVIYLTDKGRDYVSQLRASK